MSATSKSGDAKGFAPSTVRWCVQHRDGWCAAKDQSQKPDEGHSVIPTECGHYIILPFGVKKMKPTCRECNSANTKGEAQPPAKKNL
jgi:hypothetical protein